MSVEFGNEKWKSQKNWFEKDRTHVDPHDSSHTCRFTCVTRYLVTSGVVMSNFLLIVELHLFDKYLRPLKFSFSSFDMSMAA